MPIAFKEWAVTVRALAEGEQLVTLRKGGIREPGKHFELEHERFFLYPTFDHQRERPRARVAPAGAAPRPRGGRLERRRAAAARAARATAASRSPTACASAPGPRSPTTDDHRPARGRRAVAVLRLDARLRREAAALEAPPPAARAAAAHLPDPAPGHREGARRVRRLPLVARAHARPARSRARRCSPTTSSSAPPRRSRAIVAGGVPPRVDSPARGGAGPLAHGLGRALVSARRSASRATSRRDADDAARVLARSRRRARGSRSLLPAHGRPTLDGRLPPARRRCSTSRTRSLPVERLLTAPAARRYLVGSTCAARDPRARARALLAQRASNVAGLARDARCSRPARSTRGSLVGAQQPPPAAAVHARAAAPAAALGVARGGRRAVLRRPGRARAPGDRAAAARGRRPAFPPGLRDAALLGGTRLRPARARAGAARRACGLPATCDAGGPARRALAARRSRGRCAASHSRRRLALSTSRGSPRRTSAPAASRAAADSARRVLQQHLARRLCARRGHEHVARAGGEEVGHVEAAPSGAACSGSPSSSSSPWISSASAWLRAAATLHQLALGVLRLDLARRSCAAVSCALAARLAGVDQRHPAVAAEALVERGSGVAQRGQTSGASSAAIDLDRDLADRRRPSIRRCAPRARRRRRGRR